MLRLYGCAKTRSTRAVWALEEAGADYDYHSVNLMQGEGRTPSFLALNPGGKVPLLIHNDWSLTESAAICTYVGDLFPDSGLTPHIGSRLRASYNQWCFFVIGELEQPLWTLSKHRFALAANWRVPEVIPTAEHEFRTALDLLASGLEGKHYILGDTFTAADILIGQTLLWAQKAQTGPFPAVINDYLQHLTSRPAFFNALLREAG